MVPFSVRICPYPMTTPNLIFFGDDEDDDEKQQRTVSPPQNLEATVIISILLQRLLRILPRRLDGEIVQSSFRYYSNSITNELTARKL